MGDRVGVRVDIGKYVSYVSGHEYLVVFHIGGHVRPDLCPFALVVGEEFIVVDFSNFVFHGDSVNVRSVRVRYVRTHANLKSHEVYYSILKYIFK